MVAGAHHIQSAPLDMLTPVRPESRRSARARDCAHLQDRSHRLQQERQRVDSKVCNGLGYSRVARSSYTKTYTHSLGMKQPTRHTHTHTQHLDQLTNQPAHQPIPF